MYNEERKLKFLAEINDSSNYSRSIFNNAAPIEEKNNLDLCELPSDILQSLFNSSFGTSTKSTSIAISFVKKYILWCKDNGFNVCEDDGILNIKIDTTEKIRRTMVASPQHLAHILDAAADPLDANTMDCVYRCFLWLAFSGFSDKEALEVKVSEVDFDSLLIHHNGKSLELYREAVPTFKKACEATEFVYVHSNYTTVRPRFEGDKLLRGVRSNGIKTSTILNWITHKLGPIGYELTCKKLYYSGIYYKMYEAERYGVEPNFDGLIFERLENTKKEYHKNYTRNKAVGNIRKTLMDDYENWKKAFN